MKGSDIVVGLWQELFHLYEKKIVLFYIRKVIVWKTLNILHGVSCRVVGYVCL